MSRSPHLPMVTACVAAALTITAYGATVPTARARTQGPEAT
jgi:hypothetical protein